MRKFKDQFITVPTGIYTAKDGICCEISPLLGFVLRSCEDGDINLIAVTLQDLKNGGISHESSLFDRDVQEISEK